jgi:hypothetical protein
MANKTSQQQFPSTLTDQQLGLAILADFEAGGQKADQEWEMMFPGSGKRNPPDDEAEIAFSTRLTLDERLSALKDLRGTKSRRRKALVC